MSTIKEELLAAIELASDEVLAQTLLGTSDEETVEQIREQKC